VLAKAFVDVLLQVQASNAVASKADGYHAKFNAAFRARGWLGDQGAGANEPADAATAEHGRRERQRERERGSPRFFLMAEVERQVHRHRGRDAGRGHQLARPVRRGWR
jgi:hypothetical protein